ncbi:MAG: hypothetical protein FJ224_06140 [Lentisphaerae bacterium]|nr:hypothetical protein [Lentisphaerota bacterium]
MTLHKVMTAACVTAAVCLAGRNACGAVADAFAPYQVILDKQIFGEPPAPEAVVSPEVKADPGFARDLRLCALTYTEEAGIRAGVIDIKTHRNYYLSIGGEEEGVRLVDADFDEESVLVEKNGLQRRLYLDGREATAVGGVPSGIPGLVMPVRVSPSVLANLPNTTPTMAAGSYAERLMKRRIERQRQAESAAASPGLSGEQLEKHLQQYQMDVLRKGLPPLPIPLTQEMDDQLVSEGVLPPADGSQLTAPSVEAVQ